MAVTITDVETAISAIQSGGQSYQLGDLQYTAANLDALVRLRDRLREEADRSDGTRPAFRAFNFTGMGY